jgi:hypothetical protein
VGCNSVKVFYDNKRTKFSDSKFSTAMNWTRAQLDETLVYITEQYDVITKIINEQFMLL